MTTPNPNLPHNKHRRHQRGAALLILMLLVMLGLITLFTFRMDRKEPDLNADRQTALALVQAKEALLGRAFTSNTPGRIVCPAIDALGSATGLIVGNNCQGNPPSVPRNSGRVPWKTLGIPDLRDGSASQLWIVISPVFVDNGQQINSTTVATLSIVGSTTVNNLAAAIIAPGAPLAGQNRTSNALVNYVEGYVNNTTLNVPPNVAPYNDRILTITPAELFTGVTLLLARELAALNGSPPYTATSVAGLTKPTIWSANNWDAAVDTTISSVAPGAITLKFTNCAIKYTITGPSNVTRSVSSC